MGMTPEQREARNAKDAEIRERFHYHTPTEVHREWFDQHTEVLDAYIDFILLIPDSQPRAVALTQLMIVRMLVNAAIANTPAERFAEYNA